MIGQMESQLADYILRFHEYAVEKQKTSKNGGDVANDPFQRHAANFGLVRKMREATRALCEERRKSRTSLSSLSISRN